MHSLLPVAGKGSSDWSYSWIPVMGPMVGASLAAVLYLALN
jgi:glycerol uptake facilitator protein